MPDHVDPQILARELRRSRERTELLRQAGLRGPADTVAVLDATLLELDLAHEELTVCQEEMAAQAEELAARAGRPEERLAGPFQEGPAPFVVLDRHGMVRRANRAAAAMLGEVPGSLRDRPLSQFLDQPARRGFRRWLAAARRAGTPTTMTTRLRGAGRGGGGPTVTFTVWWTEPEPGHEPLVALLASQVSDADASRPAWAGRSLPNGAGHPAPRRAIEASLLPRSLPDIPGIELGAAYHPAAEDVGVGGDFYDVFPGRDSWWLVVGDVCGKDEEAAAVTAMARYSLRILGREYDEPESVLERLNEAMHAYGDTARFITVALAELRVHQGWAGARLASAGHPRAAILRPDGSVRFAAGGGLPLGLFEDLEPDVQHVGLEGGDTLVLYTDGVIEARDSAGRLFGEAGLAAALATAAGRPAAGVVAHVERALSAYQTRQCDDVVLLAVRVGAAPLPPTGTAPKPR